MRTPAGRKLRTRLQIQGVEALIGAGALAHGRRQHAPASAHPAPPEYPIPAPPPNALHLRTAPNGVELLQVPQWRDLDWLWHAFSTRQGGTSSVYAAPGARSELNLGFTADDGRDAVLRNRQLLAEAVTGDPAAPLITVKQIHSNRVVRAGRSSANSEPPKKADGLITDEPGLLLTVLTADCIPVLVADCRRRAVGAFHAGWRGTAKRIVECGVGRMRLEFGSRPEDLVAAIGPGIGPCCYAVGEEVRAAFESQFAYARDLFTEVYDPDPIRLKYPMLFLNQRAPGHAPPALSLHLDLVAANRRQLLDAGLKPEQIQWPGACTNCQTDLFFSHRAQRGRTGRMMAVIGIREPQA